MVKYSKILFLGVSNRFVNLFSFLTKFYPYVNDFIGAKIIGALGILKHSLIILLIYLETIDLWVISSEKENHLDIPIVAFTGKIYKDFH